MDVLRTLFHGFDYSGFKTNPMLLLPAAANHILGLGNKNEINGKKRFLDAMAAANVAYSLCSTLDGAMELRLELAFFSAIAAVLRKHEGVNKKRSAEQKHSALKQILDNAVKAQDVQDIFQMAGLERPNIGLLSDEFLEDVRRMEKKNLAVELLERLLKGKIKAQTRTNLVQEKKYSDRLIEALRKYHNRMIESSQVIAEMIAMAKDMQAAMKRDEDLGLNPDEIAFYDALAERPEVLLTMGDATLKKLATRADREAALQHDGGLAGAGCRSREDAHSDPATPPQIQIPAGGAGGGDRDGAEAGGGAGGCVVWRAIRTEEPPQGQDVSRHLLIRENATSSQKRGRAGGIRTRGLFVPNEALYQAEPQPVNQVREIRRALRGGQRKRSA